MKFQNTKQGQIVRSVSRPHLKYKIVRVKRASGWVVIMPLDEGFRDLRYNVRARQIKLA